MSHKPECIQGSSPTREEVVENVYVPVAVENKLHFWHRTFLQLDKQGLNVALVLLTCV